MKYRLNYGQGQVSCNASLSQVNEWEKFHGGSYVEKKEWDTGEWFPCSPKGHFLDMTAPENKDHPAK